MKFTVKGLVVALLLLGVAVWILVVIYAAATRDSGYKAMSAAGYDATIEPARQIVNVYGGKDTVVFVTVHNAGIAVWGPKRDNDTIGLGMFRQTLFDRITNREGHGNGSQSRAHPVNYYFGDGDWPATVHFTPPTVPGAYVYRLQMVDEVLKPGTNDPESGRWFGEIAEVIVVVPDAVSAATKG